MKDLTILNLEFQLKEVAAGLRPFLRLKAKVRLSAIEIDPLPEEI